MVFLQVTRYSYVTHSWKTNKKTQLEHKHSNSKSEKIHINVTVKVQNIMCHCFSPPSPKRLLKTHFIHRVTVWAVYLINMTTQHTQDFFQFHSFAFSHFTQKEQKVTTVFYFFFFLPICHNIPFLIYISLESIFANNKSFISSFKLFVGLKEKKICR